MCFVFGAKVFVHKTLGALSFVILTLVKPVRYYPYYLHMAFVLIAESTGSYFYVPFYVLLGVGCIQKIGG